jgi:hypothetical protein
LALFLFLDFQEFIPDLRYISNADHQQLLEYFDDEGRNWLMIAAANDWTQKVEELLAIGFDVDSSNHRASAIELAYENCHFDTVLVLLNKNAKFPRKFDAMTTQHAGLIAFSLLTESFHEHLQEQRVDTIKCWSTAHPNLRFFYSQSNDSFNQSAAFVTTQNALLISYNMLIACNLSFAPGEDFEAAVSQLNDEQKKLLGQIHSKHAVTMPESHLMVIRGSIFVSHDSPEAHHAELLRLAQDVFDELNEDAKMRPILKLIGRAGGFKIIFNFKHDHVQFMDPLSDQFTKGLYTTRHIYIGARGLLSNNAGKRQDVKATASHEVNHFAMDLTYDNNCLPYAKNASIAMKFKYRRVLNHCREQKHQEEIIDWVFKDDDLHVQKAELIVRVPHMRTRYAHDQQKLIRLNQYFRPLFEFYDQQVLKDVEAAIPNILTTIGERRKRFKNTRPCAKPNPVVNTLMKIGLSVVKFAIFVAIFILIMFVIFVFLKKQDSK